jgi:hypothetical protein
LEQGTGGKSRSQFALMVERRFAPYFWTQFFGSFNSNLLKNALIVLMTYHAARFAGEGSAFAGAQPGVLVNMAAGLFIVPFILFSASAGQLADKYDKAALIRSSPTSTTRRR